MSTPIKTCFAMLLLMGAACEEQDDGEMTNPNVSVAPQVTAGSAAPPSTPTNLPAPTGPSSQPGAAVPSPTSSTLIIENRFASQSVWGVYLSPSNDADWGPEQLGGKILLPGEDLTLRRIPRNLYYDLKITGAGSSTIAIVEEIPFACGVEKVVTLGG